MTVTLSLKSKVEAEIAQKASTEGMALQEYIDKLIAEAAKRQPPPLSHEEQIAKNQAALAMLREWDEEDETDDPEEIRVVKRNGRKFMAAMNESYTSNRVLIP